MSVSVVDPTFLMHVAFRALSVYIHRFSGVVSGTHGRPLPAFCGLVPGRRSPMELFRFLRC
jgi:hypothetical protein